MTIHPDELNHLLKLYQQALDDSSFNEDQKYIMRYEGVTSEMDKRLFIRFLCRICEIFDVYASKKKIPPATFLDRMQALQDQLLSKPLKISNFLSTIFCETRKASGTYQQPLAISEAKSASPQKMPDWYRNTLDNKKLHSFQEKRFWKLYEIMQLDRNFMDSVVVLHQTKLQNVERLLKLITERNEYLTVTRWCGKIQGHSFNLIIEQKLDDLNHERHLTGRRLSCYVKPIVMFGAGSTGGTVEVSSPLKRPARRLSNAIKISPARRINETREGQRRDNLSSRHQVGQTSSVESPTKEIESRRPAPLLRPITRKGDDDSLSPTKHSTTSNVNKSFVMNFPELMPAQDQRYVVIHHKDIRSREPQKRKEPPYHQSNSNLLFSNTSKHSNGITAILFLERNMRNYLSKFE